MAYKGSCHCGRIAYEVEGEVKQVIECNCSHCSRKGLLLWFVPRRELKLATPESALTEYTFNKHVIKHQICDTCGVQPFAYGKDPQGNDTAAINVRCLEGVDLDRIERKAFDGRSR